jgi:hypothetical protein
VRFRLPSAGNSAPVSPVGAATLAAAGAQVILYLLTIYWPFFAQFPSGIQLACNVLLTALLAYLGGWWRVVLTPGQQVTTTLTSSSLPTLESTPTLQGEQ